MNRDDLVITNIAITFNTGGEEVIINYELMDDANYGGTIAFGEGRINMRFPGGGLNLAPIDDGQYLTLNINSRVIKTILGDGKED